MSDKFDEPKPALSQTNREVATPRGSWTCSTCGLQIPFTSTNCPQDGTPHDAQGLLNDLLSSNYEFLGTIGTGGMSVIYKARQLLLDKTVAIKMLHSHLLNEHSIMRFQQEAKAASSLKHPNVIAVHDFGISKSGQPFMVMDFIDGITLAQLIQDRGAIPLPEAMDIFIAVSGALEHAHEKNLLHRDLKPSNIMLRQNSTGYDVFLVDFGIAKIIDTESGGVVQQLTQTGEVMGSPLYMSPEQCMGKKVDQRSDLYSLGCIMYEAVAGVPPHRGETMIETIFKHLNEEAQPLHVARPEISFPGAFEDLVMKLLATQVEDRIQSAAEVKKRLLAIQAGALRGSQTFKGIFPLKFQMSRQSLINKSCLLFALFSVLVLALADRHLKQSKELQRQVDEALAKRPVAGVTLRQPTPLFQESEAKHMLIPPTLDNLNRLDLLTEKVDLHQTPVQDRDLPALKKLTKLKVLNLSNTQITDKAFLPISKLKTLTELYLKGTKLTPAALKQLISLPNLCVIDLDDTAADDTTMEAICHLQNVQKLCLRNTKITNKSLPNLKKELQLSSLSLSGTKISNEGLRYLSIIDLHNLDLWDTQVTSGGIKNLARCSTLENLRLSRVQLSQDDLKAISGLVNLHELQLYHVNNLRDDDLKFFVPMKALKNLYIEDCPLTDAAASYLAQMRQLTGLCLNGTAVTDTTLARITDLQNLESLWLQMTRVGNAGMKSVAKLKALKNLYIDGTLVGDEGLEALHENPDLNYVEASFCRKISLAGIVAYYKNHPQGYISLHYTD